MRMLECFLKKWWPEESKNEKRLDKNFSDTEPHWPWGSPEANSPGPEWLRVLVPRPTVAGVGRRDSMVDAKACTLRPL